MTYIKFEFKKAIKRRVLIYILIYALFVAFFAIYNTKENNVQLNYPEFVNISPEYFFTSKAFLYLKTSKDNNLKDKLFNNSNRRQDIINQVLLSDNNDKKLIKELQNIDYNNRNIEDRFIKENNIRLTDKESYLWRWSNLELNYSQANNLITKTNEISYKYTNISRIILFNSNIIFGLPTIIFFILIFHDIFSKERESETNNFLFTQGYKKSRQILTTSILIIIFSCFYFIFLFIFLTIICVLLKIDIFVFDEIFLKHGSLLNLEHEKAYVLITKSIIIFIINILFVTGLISIFSSLFLKTNTILISLLFTISFLYLLTDRYSIMQSRFNFIYALDPYLYQCGKLSSNELYGGAWDFTIINSMGFKNIIYIFLQSIFLLILSVAIKSKFYIKTFDIANYIKNIEIKKLVYQSNILNHLFFTVILIIYLSTTIFRKDLNALNQFIYNKDYINSLKNSFENNYSKLKSEYKLTDKNIEKLLESPEDIEDINLQILIENTSNSKTIFKRHSNLIKAYKKGDSTNFYKYLLDNKKDRFNLELNNDNPFVYKNNRPTNLSIFEDELITEKALKNNNKPVFSNGFNHSIYEDYVSRSAYIKERDLSELRDTTSPILLYKMINNNNIDMLILSLILISILSGYSKEKEYNNNLHLIYTQPINKIDYHIKRVLLTSLTSFLIIIVIHLLIVLLGSFLGGFGDWTYPLIDHIKLIDNPDHASKKIFLESVTTIPIWKYALRNILMLSINSYLICALAYLISIFTKSHIKTKFITFTIIGLMLFLSYVIDINIIKIINPFTYIISNKVIDGSIKVLLNIKNQNFYISFIIVALYAILITIIGARLIKKVQQ